MIIELKGIPGSGKSFLCDELYLRFGENKSIKSNSIIMPSGFKKILTNYSVALKLNVSLVYIFFLFLSTNVDKKIKKHMFSCLWKNIKKIYILKKYYKYDYYIIDEGITHPLSIFDKIGVDKYYKIILGNRWLKSIINETIYIYNECDIDSCIKRIFSRNQSIPVLFENKSEDEIKKHMSNEVDIIRYQLELYKRQNINYVVFKNRENVDLLYNELINN